MSTLGACATRQAAVATQDAAEATRDAATAARDDAAASRAEADATVALVVEAQIDRRLEIQPVLVQAVATQLMSGLSIANIGRGPAIRTVVYLMGAGVVLHTEGGGFALAPGSTVTDGRTTPRGNRQSNGPNERPQPQPSTRGALSIAAPRRPGSSQNLF